MARYRIAAARIACAIAVHQVLLGDAVFAAQPTDVRIDRAWLRTPISDVRATLAFMTVETSTSAKIIAVSSNVARAIKLQYTVKTGETILRQSVDEVPLIAGRPLVMSLDPGSYHLMPIGLRRKLAPGENVPLTVTVQRGTEKPRNISVVATVRTPQGFNPVREEDVH